MSSCYFLFIIKDIYAVVEYNWAAAGAQIAMSIVNQCDPS